MSESLEPSSYRELLRRFLEEDLGAGDITTGTVVPAGQRARGELIANAPLVLAGLDPFIEVFRLLDPSAVAEIGRKDGEELRPGESPVQVRGLARALLSGERVALNLLQRLSGIATLTRCFVRAVAGTGVQILDTRKTTPGLRALEKYAVCTGGGRNHRQDLAEAILIKENHIRLAGGVAAALQAAQPAKRGVAWTEIEVTNFDELRDALEHSPDVILLDTGSHGVHQVDPDTEANQDEMRLGILLMDAAQLLFEIRHVVNLAVIGLAKTQPLNVVAQAG